MELCGDLMSSISNPEPANSEPKQIAIISGKGGTGKTTFSALIHSIEGCVIADCDVDAPNLHILLNPEILEVEEYYASKKARILQDKCSSCGLCYGVCRFNAIFDKPYTVNDKRCEGCGFCYNACSEKAIVMETVKTGEIYKSKTRYGHFVHALLKAGEENTGRLVTEVRQRAKKIAEDMNFELVIVDAPPGVGCPVIASLTDVDAAIVISEPTLSGLNDLKRVLDLCDHFGVKAFVTVNKYDLNESMALEIRDYCEGREVEFLGSIPFDKDLIEQVSNLKYPFDCIAAEKMSECWKTVRKRLL
jgi:MinD superfamily P-loop ATPase